MPAGTMGVALGIFCLFVCFVDDEDEDQRGVARAGREGWGGQGASARVVASGEDGGFVSIGVPNAARASVRASVLG